MIPISLKIRNFMCYREVAPIDFRNMHLACLSGENGAGKSTIIDAITWALWGEARGNASDEDLMCKGMLEMEVEFQFVLNEQYFLVVRKRQKKGRLAVPMLDLHTSPAGEDGTWHSLTEANITLTQKRIDEFLKINYATFINSAFIMQGKADSFSVADPRMRKKLLTEILGLDSYEEYEKRAKQTLNDLKSKGKQLEEEVDRINGFLEGKPEYESELKDVLVALQTAAGQLGVLRLELSTMEKDQAKLQESGHRVTELAQLIQKSIAERELWLQQISDGEKRVAELGTLLRRREEIEQQYGELQQARQREQALTEALGRVRALENRQAILAAAIGNEKSRLEGEANTQRKLAESEKAEIEKRSGWETELAVILQEIAALSTVEDELKQEQKRQSELETESKRARSDQTSKLQERSKVEDKLRQLKALHMEHNGEAECPLCGSELSEEALLIVEQNWQSEIESLVSQYDKLVQEAAARDMELAECRKASEILVGKVQELRRLTRSEAELRQKLEGLVDRQQRYDEAVAKREKIETTLASGEYAVESRAELAKIVEGISTLGYSDEQHKEVAERRRKLEAGGYEELYHKLQSAAEDLPRQEQTLNNARLRVEKIQRDREDAEKESERLRPRAEELQALNDRIVLQKAKIELLEGEERSGLQRQGTLQQLLKDCDSREESRKEKVSEHEKVSHRQKLYSDLAAAFGRNGIPAIIIENVIPELEDEANELLGRMTDGRMSVQLITQKDLKTREGVIETLEVIISDELGTRPYGLYSGGESFRVNFALRVALSKLLARRAGTHLQMLVVDEGFGSQDASGRERMVSAIQSIQDDFATILVITHIEELKEEFPTRIMITKTPTGSRVDMSGAGVAIA